VNTSTSFHSKVLSEVSAKSDLKKSTASSTNRTYILLFPFHSKALEANFTREDNNFFADLSFSDHGLKSSSHTGGAGIIPLHIFTLSQQTGRTFCQHLFLFNAAGLLLFFHHFFSNLVSVGPLRLHTCFFHQEQVKKASRHCQIMNKKGCSSIPNQGSP